MRTMFTLWVFALVTPVFSVPTAKKSTVAQELPDDDVEFQPPMEPFESVDTDVNEEADTEGQLQELPHSHPVLVHPSGPGGQHSRKSQEKAPTKKVAVKKNPRKDPNPMNTLHRDIQTLHNKAVDIEKAVDSVKPVESAGTFKDSPEAVHGDSQVKVQHHGEQPQAPKSHKSEPVVKPATASPVKPATVAPVEPATAAVEPATSSPASPVSHQVSNKKGNAAQASDTVAPDAPKSKTTMDKLSQALAPPEAPKPKPESEVEWIEPAKIHKGKHKKKQKVQDSSMKRIVTQTTTTVPEVQKHPDLQSQVAELNADLQDEQHIAPVPANVEANLESKLDTEDKQKAADKSPDEQEVKPPQTKQHGKHKHGKGKKKAEETAPQQAAVHEDPLDQLHSDVHHETAQPDVVQHASVTPKPQVTEDVEKTQENGSEKLASDTSGDTVVSISKRLAKAVESKLENALQPPAKPQPAEKVTEPQAHHAHGKKHKKHSKHQDVTPAWSKNSTNGDAIKALHRDTQKYRADESKPASKPAPAVAPAKAAEASHVAPEEKLRNDLGMKNDPAPAKPAAQASVSPPAVHTLVHKSQKHHRGKSHFVVGNVTYKDPMAAVHHDAAAVSAKVKPQNASQATNKMQPAANKSIAPLAKLSKDLGVNSTDAKKLPGSSVHRGHAVDNVNALHSGKHHNFLKKKKKEQEVEPPAPTEKPPYNVSLMHNAIRHLDHAIQSEENSHMARGRAGHKFHIVDEDRPEGYPTL